MSGSVAGFRRIGASLVASRRRVALAWAAATLVVLAPLGGAPGISRDEAAVLEAADAALRAPGSPAPAARLAPPLGAHVAAATHAALSPLGLSHLRAARIGTALLAALLSASLALLAWELSGPAAALLGPALFWAAPRHLHAGLVATPDLALAALWAATVLACRHAAFDPAPLRRRSAAVGAGLLFGAALAARADAWVLFPVLAVHAGLSRALHAGGPERRTPAVPAALVAMAALGPAVLLAAWPSAWTSPLASVSRAFAPPGRTFPASYPALVTALAVPATLLFAYLAGVGHALLRIVRAVRGRAPAASVPDEALLLLCAAAPFAAAMSGVAPAVGGVRPWLHAMPFLAVLGARALLAAARVAWPARSAALAASLALLVLWPAIHATAHFHPAGASAWNEIAGGAPGAATLGMERQDGGEAAVSVLEAVNARALRGARVFWPTTAPAAVRAFARDGRLRDDLVAVDSPEEADLAVVTLDGGSRDAEYRTWSSFRTSRPAAGVYLDEVPLAFVYARPGTWR